MDFSTSVAYNYNEITKEYTKCYPQTHMNAVYTKDDETETLGNKLSDIDDKIEGTTRVFSSDTKPIKDGIWFDSSDTQSNVQQNSVAKEIINYIDTNIKNNVDNNTQNIESITTQLSENTQQISDLQTNKADKTDINSLATNKADNATVQALSTQVNSLASVLQRRYH
jgi:hypothetical protein